MEMGTIERTLLRDHGEGAISKDVGMARARDMVPSNSGRSGSAFTSRSAEEGSDGGHRPVPSMAQNIVPSDKE
ncbi:hypothetical protein YTPLAS18_36500 [Nitrospira sp.]|nr:hypothetical protein YTPLAS18_36500 [Nitrospira sp.]